MKLLIRLGFNLGFLPIFHFPVRRARFPLPVLRLSNIQNPDERLQTIDDGRWRKSEKRRRYAFAFLSHNPVQALIDCASIGRSPSNLMGSWYRIIFTYFPKKSTASIICTFGQVAAQNCQFFFYPRSVLQANLNNKITTWNYALLKFLDVNKVNAVSIYFSVSQLLKCFNQIY